MFPSEWWADVTLSGVYTLRILDMFLMLPVLSLCAVPLLGAENNRTLAGAAMSIYELTQAVLQLPLGTASDKFDRKKIIHADLIAFAAGSFLAAATDPLHVLVAVQAVQGAGTVSAAVTALLADLIRDEVRTCAMIMMGLNIGLTSSVNLVLAPVIAGFINVPDLFMLTGALTISSIAAVARTTPNPEVSKFHEGAQTQPSRMGEVLKNHQFLTSDFGVFASHTAQVALFTVLPLALENLGLTKV